MGILGALFGGGGGTTKIGKKAVKDLWERSQAVADMPFQPYEGPRVADLSAVTKAGIGLAQNAVNAGSGAINAAINVAKAGGGYTPTTVTGAVVAPTANVTGANINRSLLGTIGANSITGMNIDEYMNPYLRNVADTTMADLAFQREQQRGVDNARAVKAGAFGGDRQAIVDAQTNDMFSRTAATTLSDLYAKGYDAATGLMTTDANRAQAGQVANQTTDLAVGNANAGFAQQAALANQGVQYTTAQQNAELAQQAALANQSADLEGGRLRLSSAGLLGDIGSSQAQNAVNAAKAVTEAGQLETQNAQMKLDADFQEFLRKQGYPVSMIQMLQGSAGIAAGTQTNSSGGIIPGFASLIGAANKPGS